MEIETIEMEDLRRHRKMKQRLIDASQIENKFLHWLNEISKDITNDIYQGSESDGIAACLEEIRGTPTIDPENLRPRSYWEDVYQTGPCSFSGRCHACGVRNDIPPVEQAYYCPCCGAKMED